MRHLLTKSGREKTRNPSPRLLKQVIRRGDVDLLQFCVTLGAQDGPAVVWCELVPALDAKVSRTER